MVKIFKDSLRPHIPFFILALYRFLRGQYRYLLYTFRLTSTDKNSKIYLLLREKWKNYKTDLYPIDRKMSILKKKNVRGMSTENIRFFINESVRKFADGGVYLEVGMLWGCSLLSAALFNRLTRCIGIDNFSEYNDKNRNEDILIENLKKFNSPPNIEFYNQDYKAAISKIFSKEPGLKVNVYYYDGDHNYENQIEGLNIMLPHLAHKCIILVDDVNWKTVEDANEYFVKTHPSFRSVFKIKTEINGSGNWWNGFEVIARGLDI